jgi:hypothetical protein
LLLVELTVPYKSSLEQQHTFKTAKYEDLVRELGRQGFNSKIMAVEVSARGLVASSMVKLFNLLGLKSRERARALKAIAESAENASCWLWHKRNEPGPMS